MEIELISPIKDSFGKPVTKLVFPDPPLRVKHTRGVMMLEPSVPFHDRMMGIASNMLGLSLDELGELEWEDAKGVVELMMLYFPSTDSEQREGDR